MEIDEEREREKTEKKIRRLRNTVEDGIVKSRERRRRGRRRRRRRGQEFLKDNF